MVTVYGSEEKKEGGRVEVNSTITDTGERKDMFGS